MTMTLTATASTRLTPVSAWPPDRNPLTYVVTNADAMPGYLSSITDSTWGTKITRISNSIGYRPDYAKKPGWSPDGQFIALRNGGTTMFLNASDYSLYRTSTAFGSEVLWPNTVGNFGTPRMLTITGGKVLAWRNLADDSTTLIHDFTAAGYQNLELGYSEGNLSDDDRYIVLCGDIAGAYKVLLYDMVTDAIVVKATTTQCNWAGVSHLGVYIVIQWSAAGSGAEQGSWLYDQTLGTAIRQISTRGGNHIDFGIDTSGNEVTVDTGNTAGQGTPPRMHRLVDGVETWLLRYYVTYDPLLFEGFPYGHVSGRNISRPGWIYFSNYDSTHTYRGNDQVAAVKLDGSYTAEVFGFSHHGTDYYNNDPMARPNQDGTKVMFVSEWGGDNTVTNCYAYVASNT